MKTNDAMKLLEDDGFLDKIYHFSYHRCSTSFEAEDLSSDIVLAVIAAIQKQDHIDNLYAFVWTVAHRAYADYCRKKNVEPKVFSIENGDLFLTSKENEIEELVEKEAKREELSRIFKEIAFLSREYRETIIMYYIDELKVKDIAVRLDINETTVKQRLFSARNTIRKEVETMSERSYVLKPVKFAFSGTGNPVGNDPRTKAERMFSQNLIYLCKDKPRSAKELSEKLCVPMPYIEEELEIQCHGENGIYGMLRKLDNGKYAINIHLVDYEEYDQANKIYEKHLSEFCSVIKKTLCQSGEKILSFSYLNEQKNLRFIMWSLISRIVWEFEDKINIVLAEKYFSDFIPIKRAYTDTAVAYTDAQKPAFDFYSCDGNNATSVGGYKSVFVSNIYGKHIDAHFHCGHDISQDPKLIMVLRAIDGICIDNLSEVDREIAAKALECGYLRKKGNTLEPKIIVINKNDAAGFYALPSEFTDRMGNIIEEIAFELSAFMKAHIPMHLMNEYPFYTQLIAGTRILSKAIDECIKEDVLSKPENRLDAEGVLMIVDR